MEQIPTLDSSEELVIDRVNEPKSNSFVQDDEPKASDVLDQVDAIDKGKKSPWISEFSHFIEAGKEASKARKVSTDEKWEMAMLIYPPLRQIAGSMAVMNKKHLNALGRGVVKAKNVQEINLFCNELVQKVSEETSSNEVVQSVLASCMKIGAEKTLQFKKIYAMVKNEAEQNNEHALECLQKLTEEI